MGIITYENQSLEMFQIEEELCFQQFSNNNSQREHSHFF